MEKINALEELFNEKVTENGDIAYNSTGTKQIDLVFMSEYYTNHLNEIPELDKNEFNQWLARFIRDPRFGMGRRDLGRFLMWSQEVSPQDMAISGRFDDLLSSGTCLKQYVGYVIEEAKNGNELAKKWLPRLTSGIKSRQKANIILKEFNISPKEYRKLIKVDTTESKLSEHKINEIDYSKVPSLALLKYYNRFLKEDSFKTYLESVKKGESKINTSVVNVYDILKNRHIIDCDLYFEKQPKIDINCLTILDSSDSMWDSNDSITKASSIAHYLTKNTSYYPNYLLNFSDNPKLIKLNSKEDNSSKGYWSNRFKTNNHSKYINEVNSMLTNEVASTDFGKVIKLLQDLKEFPEYFVVLSDMEFNSGSNYSLESTMQLFKENNVKTKIVWWNFNSRNKTVPEADKYGNIFLSGYSPQLLKFLQAGMNAEKFVETLVNEYKLNFK